MQNLKPSQVTAALLGLIRAGVPAFLLGSPGIGKSDTVRAVATALLARLYDVRATLLDAVDLRGLPAVVKGVTTWAPPVFLPQLKDRPADWKPGMPPWAILFLDELNAAAASVQTACYQLILDRRLGEYELPDGVAIIAAGNRITDGASATVMPSALANRFAWIEMCADVEDWALWAARSGVVPELQGFVRFRPAFLAETPKRGSLAFSTPRSLAFASKVLREKLPPSVEHAVLQGVVGEGCATELVAYLGVHRGLPDLRTVIANPDTAPVPGQSEPALRYAMAYALAAAADVKTWGAVLRYLARMPLEYAVLAVKAATTRDESLCNTPEFTKWALKHQDALS